MAVTITRRVEFDAGHRIPHHDSKCRNLHGHRYVVEATLQGDVQPADGRSEGGMVLDFGKLTAWLNSVADLLDHGFLVWRDDAALISFLTEQRFKHAITHEPPTAEYLAQWISERLAYLIVRDERAHIEGVHVVQVKVWETPNCSATWTALGGISTSGRIGEVFTVPANNT